jgi:uncharacterized protein YggE
MPIFVVLGALLLTCTLALQPQQVALAQDPIPTTTPTRQVSVTGIGEVTAQPDVAVVTLGVQTEADEAGAALDQNSQQTQALLDALSEAGIAEENIQTQVIQLQPQYAAPPPQPTAQMTNTNELLGYLASNVVEVRIENLDEVGSLIDSAINAGGNRIDSIRFEISDRSAILSQAREAAWNDAQQKAQQYAELAGAELGEVLTISTFEQTPVPVASASLARDSIESVPIQPGTQSVNVQVQVVWQLQ